MNLVDNAHHFRTGHRNRIQLVHPDSPRRQHPLRVQVDRFSPEEVESSLDDEIRFVDTHEKFTLVNRTEGNILVAERTILVNGMVRQNVQEERRKRYRYTVRFFLNSVRQRFHHTPRALYYSNTELFKSQSRSDEAIHDVCANVGCNRNSLLIFAEDRGCVIGALQYMVEDGGDAVRFDCNYQASPPTRCKLPVAIPPFIERVTHIQSDQDLLFILYIEKYSAFSLIAQSNFHNKYRCLLITGKGEADVATKLFTNRVSEELRLPVFCLCDYDVGGLGIYIHMKYGSQNMAYDSKNMACTNMYFLGVSGSDLELMDDSFKHPISKNDSAAIRAYLNKDWVIEDPILNHEFTLMLQNEKKTSLEDLNRLNTDGNGLFEIYLPSRLNTVMLQNMPPL